MQIKKVGMAFLVAAGSLVVVVPAFAGVAINRLNGSFSFEQEGTTDVNTACVELDFGSFEVFGLVTGTTAGCTVEIDYAGFAPHKVSASLLKSDDTGSASVSQQSRTFAGVAISGVECAVAPYDGQAFPDKCKVSGSVKATEGPDTVDQGKVSLTCEFGEEGSELVPSPTTQQVDTIIAAFADRKDVKISSAGKLTIKTSGSQDDGDGCD